MSQGNVTKVDITASAEAVRASLAAAEAFTNWTALLSVEHLTPEYKQFAKVQITWVGKELGSPEHEQYLLALAALEALPKYQASVAAFEHARLLSREAKRLLNV
jgi:hypothetical protein